MAQRIVSCAQKLTHDNYATSTGGATKTLPKNTKFILIHNIDSTNSVLVSFDGTNFKTVQAGSILSLDVDFNDAASPTTYTVKSSASTPNVECLYGSEA